MLAVQTRVSEMSIRKNSAIKSNAKFSKGCVFEIFVQFSRTSNTEEVHE